VSWGLDDLRVPVEKKQLLIETEEEIENVHR